MHELLREEKAQRALVTEALMEHAGRWARCRGGVVCVGGGGLRCLHQAAAATTGGGRASNAETLIVLACCVTHGCFIGRRVGRKYERLADDFDSLRSK